MNKIIKHGGYVGGKETPEHYVWRAMIDRCTKPKHRWYSKYGGRGITVCEEWLDYSNFLASVGGRPSAEHTLERIDNNKGYNPENVRWATKSEQQKNKSTTSLYISDEFSGTLVECAEHLGISKELAYYRFKHWGTFEKGKQWHKRPKSL